MEYIGQSMDDSITLFPTFCKSRCMDMFWKNACNFIKKRAKISFTDAPNTTFKHENTVVCLEFLKSIWHEQQTEVKPVAKTLNPRLKAKRVVLSLLKRLETRW